LLSVPYALKAADAQTLGGLPASAFVLAGSQLVNSQSATTVVSSTTSGSSPVGGTGTQNYIPIWTDNTGDLGNSILYQSGSGATAKIGINQKNPLFTLDVNGQELVRGLMEMATTNYATPTKAYNSQPFNLESSAYNSGTAKYTLNHFQWQAEPTGNNTTTPGATLNLLYGTDPAAPAETGLKLSSAGLFTFASGQTFPGTGTITGVTTAAGSGLTGGGTSGTLNLALTNTCSANQILQWNGTTWVCTTIAGGGTITGVTAGTDLTGGGTSGNVTLNLDNTKVPQLKSANTFTGNQTVNGNLTATGVVTGSSYQIGSNLFAFGSYANGNAFLGFAGNSTTTGTDNTGTGWLSLSSNTTGTYNTANGWRAQSSNTTGSYNTSLGYQTLSNNTTGSFNTAVGFSSLGSGLASTNNTAVGYSALSVSSGAENTAAGSLSLADNANGTKNTAVGYSTLANNLSGVSNTAVGWEALLENISLCCNTAIGSSALQQNTLGVSNTAAGYSALGSNTQGNDNTAAGDSALGSNTEGIDNTAEGSQALFGNTKGNGNTAVGENALFSNTTGSDVTCVGFSCDTASPTLSNATAIGAFAVVGSSNALVLGGTASHAVTVSVGTATPFNDYGLDVDTTNSNGVIDGGVVVNASGGNLYLGMTANAHKFRVDTNGVVFADGGYQSSGADFAESMAVRGPRSEYEPGDVLEIDRTADRHLTLAHHRYATLVAGIYSTKPGLLATPHNIDDPVVKAGEVPLAVVGIVPCKVTTENGPIARGDLLVTSSRPGYAMKGTDRRRMLGAVVGKALEPLATKTGIIEVLVTLQ
jgi:hypothetical protein